METVEEDCQGSGDGGWQGRRAQVLAERDFVLGPEPEAISSSHGLLLRSIESNLFLAGSVQISHDTKHYLNVFFRLADIRLKSGIAIKPRRSTMPCSKQ